MKKLLALLPLALLTSCVSYQTVSSTTQTETITNLVYRPSEATVYALGNQFDYQVNPCKDLQSKDEPIGNDRCLATLKWVTSDEIRPKIVSVQIPTLNIITESKNRVFGSYQAYIRLTDEQAKAYLAQKIDLRKADKNEQQSLGQNDTTPLYYAQLVFYGNALKIQNRDEIMKLGQLKSPISVQMQHDVMKKSYSAMPVLKGAAGIVLVPVGIVAVAPMLGAYLMYGEVSGGNK